MVLLDIPINDLVLLNPGFKRYINILRESGIETSADLIRDYLGCKLDHINGLGRKFFSILKNLANNQRKYKNMYIEIKNNQGE